ncbi:MAG: hypothetical protein HWD58_17880 [Bacteroidota bacterium]|nr:MAG: hypothetical protein HWD58_17880 [Bacteroidota bacterium]
MTPTGKVVREILKSELGPLHVGRNITEFRWKGDDRFGQPRKWSLFISCGHRFERGLMEHFSSAADQWIEKGFGKMYIMR